MATIKNIHDYSDIINRPYKKSKKYKHMSQKDRAAQFAPFAALKEFEACVCKKEELYVPYLELSDEAKEEIDFKLRMLNYMTGSV